MNSLTGTTVSAKTDHRPGRDLSLLVLLGAMGGAFGAYAYLLWIVLWTPNPYNVFVIVALPVLMVFDGAVGAMVGLFLWLTIVFGRTKLSAEWRAWFGCATMFAVMTLLSLAYGLVTSVPSRIVSWLPVLMMHAVTVGLPTGLWLGLEEVRCQELHTDSVSVQLAQASAVR